MLYINQFIDKVASADTRNAKEIILPLKDAKLLHADITKLLLVLEDFRQQRGNQSTTDTKIEIVSEDF